MKFKNFKDQLAHHNTDHNKNGTSNGGTNIIPDA